MGGKATPNLTSVQTLGDLLGTLSTEESVDTKSQATTKPTLLSTSQIFDLGRCNIISDHLDINPHG